MHLVSCTCKNLSQHLLFLTLIYSVMCSALDSAWNNVETDANLPVLNGDEISLTCPSGYEHSGSSKATCKEGLLIVDTGSGPPQCSEISKFHPYIQ